jgi:RHS repeat-associated protein
VKQGQHRPGEVSKTRPVRVIGEVDEGSVASEVQPETAAFDDLARHCYDPPVVRIRLGRSRPHRRDAHRGQRPVFGHTRGGRYSWARYYHPALQRFISEDPIGFAAGDVNLYAYVANAPLDFSDPSGMSLADAAIPGYCQDPTYISPTPELSGRKGVVAQIVAAELSFLGLVRDVLACSIVDVPGGLLSVGGQAARAPFLVSRIKESPRLVRGAEATGRSVQRSIDHLTAELGRGNLNPGIGTRAIGRGLSEARARDGARVYFRQAPDGTIEILGKSTKHNQAEVIREVLRIFGQ